MKIENSSISMSSSYSYLQSYSREESYKAWSGNNKQPDSEIPQNTALFNFQSVTLELSDQAQKLLSEGKDLVSEAPAAEDPEFFEISAEDRLKIQVIEQMMQSLTGKKFKFYMLEKLRLKEEPTNIKNIGGTVSSPDGPRRQGWGVEYHLHQSYREQEQLSINTQGTIKTSDGREIDFSVQLNMSRDYAVENDINIRAGDAAVDPLVISFDGKTAELTQTKFSFDLDSDGKEDQISFVQPGSGFLALDLNNDGLINDGQELFGPTTGNGFSELAKFDLDGNQWIDENDSVYNKLRIWTKDSDGNDVLMALGQAGIGAIYLGNIVSPFHLKDDQNNLMGQVRQTGIYVKEDGFVGSVQQIDLVV